MVYTRLRNRKTGLFKERKAIKRETNFHLAFPARCFSRSRWEKRMLASCLTWLDSVSNGGIKRMKNWNVFEMGSRRFSWKEKKKGKRKKKNRKSSEIRNSISKRIFRHSVVWFWRYIFTETKSRSAQKHRNINSKEEEGRRKSIFHLQRSYELFHRGHPSTD